MGNLTVTVTPKAEMKEHGSGEEDIIKFIHVQNTGRGYYYTLFTIFDALFSDSFAVYSLYGVSCKTETGIKLVYEVFIDRLLADATKVTAGIKFSLQLLSVCQILFLTFPHGEAVVNFFGVHAFLWRFIASSYVSETSSKANLQKF